MKLSKLSIQKSQELLKIAKKWVDSEERYHGSYTVDMRQFFIKNKIKFNEKKVKRDDKFIWIKSENGGLSAKDMENWYSDFAARIKVNADLEVIKADFAERFDMGCRPDVRCKLCAVLDNYANFGIFFFNWREGEINYYLKHYSKVPFVIDLEDYAKHLDHIIVSKRELIAEDQPINQLAIIDQTIRMLQKDIEQSRKAHFTGKNYIEKVEKLTQLLKVKDEMINRSDVDTNKTQLADVINILLTNPNKGEDKVIEIVETTAKDKGVESSAEQAETIESTEKDKKKKVVDIANALDNLTEDEK